MDPKSILFLFGSISTCIGLLFLYFILFNKRRNGFLIAYSISKFIQAAGVFFIGSRYAISDFISLSIGGSLLIIGYATELFCVISYDFSFKRSVFKAILIPVALVLIIFLSFPVNYLLAMIFYISAGYLFAFGAANLLIRKEKTSLVRLVSVTYILFSLSWFTSAVGAFVLKEDFKLVTGDNMFEMINYIFSILYLIIGSVGYLMILKEEDERSMREMNTIIELDNQELKELNRTKDRFFSIIAHDLRGPIGAMIQLGEILNKTHKEISVQERELLISSISKSAGKTFNLLENLLQWSRSETGRLIIQSAEMDISEIAADTLELLEESVRQKNIHISNEIREPVKAYGDPDMIKTVIRNIISNAIKYVHENGNIILSAETVPENGRVRIRISDDGVGIDPGVVNSLFDLDHNYTTRGTNNESGSGLGLKLCKEFVEKNNGEIHAESEVGKGSTFEIRLPARST
jgi:signal transduction histidine kinase